MGPKRAAGDRGQAAAATAAHAAGHGRARLMRELELKLAVDEPFRTPPALAPGTADVAGMEELPALDLRATYYDTQDLRLARHGITLRYRTGEGAGSGWHVKLPDPDGDRASRDE